jgi:RNA polymerase sigma-70 factor (ECF subfamily)
VTANVCKNKLRRERLFAPLKYISKLTKGSDPAQQLAQEERTRTIREAIEQLKPAYRMPLVLRYYADLDYKEIAEALGLPEGTVKTRLHRAKAELKRILEQKGVAHHARP